MKACNADATIHEARITVESGPLGCRSPFFVGSNLRNFKKAITETLIIEGMYVVYIYDKTKDQSQII